VNGCAAGLELFDASRTWRTLAPKLIRSYALDALDKDRASVQRNAEADATALIQELMSSAASVFPSVTVKTCALMDRVSWAAHWWRPAGRST
jgi:hypothetical protein